MLLLFYVTMLLVLSYDDILLMLRRLAIQLRIYFAMHIYCMLCIMSQAVVLCAFSGTRAKLSLGDIKERTGIACSNVIYRVLRSFMSCKEMVRESYSLALYYSMLYDMYFILTIMCMWCNTDIPSDLTFDIYSFLDFIYK